jgi:hypothetical protein
MESSMRTLAALLAVLTLISFATIAEARGGRTTAANARQAATIRTVPTSPIHRASHLHRPRLRPRRSHLRSSRNKRPAGVMLSNNLPRFVYRP